VVPAAGNDSQEASRPVLTPVTDYAPPEPMTDAITPEPEEVAVAEHEPEQTLAVVSDESGENDTDTAYDLPEILRDSEPAAGRHKLLLGSVLAMLLLAFMLLQVMYFWRAELLPRYEFLRPTLQTMCEVTGCELPLRKNLERITLLDREVRSHPVNAEALQVTATIINTADYIQSFPVIRITLSNRHGRIIASRDFQPPEYLSDNIDIGKGLAPKQPLHIELEVSDPGKDAVGFTFEFL
jgi:hypothetical protein